MMKVLPALIALSTVFTLACNGADSAAPQASADADAQRTPANSTPINPPIGATPGIDAAGQPVNEQGAATLEFRKKIDAYVKIHNEAESQVPNLKRTDDPKEIADRESALAKAIMTLRAGAQPGEIFAPEYQPYFVKIVQDDFKLRSAADRRALVAELPRDVKVDINTVYPTTLPLETFPPALLRKLPDLPPELEYRIVGRSLILRDVKANLIVDILRDVVPTIPS